MLSTFNSTFDKRLNEIDYTESEPFHFSPIKNTEKYLEPNSSQIPSKNLSEESEIIQESLTSFDVDAITGANFSEIQNEPMAEEIEDN